MDRPVQYPPAVFFQSYLGYSFKNIGTLIDRPADINYKRQTPFLDYHSFVALC